MIWQVVFVWGGCGQDRGVSCLSVGKISSYVSSKAGSDSLSSHISEAMAKRAGSGSASANFTPRSDITGAAASCIMLVKSADSELVRYFV